MSELTHALQELIASKGPISFFDFMSQALYHPEYGYYSSNEPRTGWAGHFVTSPELDDAFGALWVRGLEEIWERCGRPQRFEAVELGAGEGGFAAAVRGHAEGAFGRALEYVIVERSGATRNRQLQRLGSEAPPTWVASLTELAPAKDRCVIANEVLDNFPVHVVERDGDRLLEVFVEMGNGGFREVLRPCSNEEIAGHPAARELRDGHRIEIAPGVDVFATQTAAAIETGAVILIDYGVAEHEIGQRPQGTLVAYSERGVSARVLDAPGEQDITAHVNWSHVRRALTDAGFLCASPRSQHEMLSALGAPDYDRALRLEHETALAEADGRRALRALSRRQSLQALRDPGGLGALQVLVAVRRIELPQFALGA